MKVRVFFLSLLELLLGHWTLALAEIEGKLQVYPGLQEIPKGPSGTETLASVNISSRTQGDLSFEGGGFHWAYGLALSLWSKPLSPPVAAYSFYRVTDLPDQLAVRPHEGKVRTTLQQNLDRLIIRMPFTAFDLSLGRQAITFGVSRLANPSDVFAPYLLPQLEQEYRIGMDGIRLTFPLGVLSEWEFISLLGKGAALDQSAQIVSYRTNYGGLDAQGLISVFRKAALMAANLEGALGDLALRGELALVKPPKNEQAYLRLIGGFAYFARSADYWDLELYHNAAGALSRFAYPKLASQFAYRHGGVFLKGRDYLSMSYQRQLSPFRQLGLQWIANFSDGSQLVAVNLSLSPSDESKLEGGFFFAPIGTSKPSTHPGEFSYLSEQIYVSASLYW